MPPVTVQQAFELALQHHRAGRLAEAEALYRQILAVDPRHADALHLLGALAHQVGRNDVAVGLIRQAIAVNPDYPEAYNNLGVALRDHGQLDEAIASYRRAIALRPDYSDAHNNLGTAMRDRGQLDEAIASCRQAIAYQPNSPEAHNNLGTALVDQGQVPEAIASYRRAIALRSDYPEAHNNLGTILGDQGQLEEAGSSFRRAIALRPDCPEAHYNLGNVVRDQGQLDEAIASYRQAIALRFNYPVAHNNLGIALKDQGQLDEAIAAYRRALALRPDYPDAHSNLGTALRHKGQLDEAIAAYRQAVTLKSNYPETHSNLALALLLQGDFLQGWEEYEWRWKLKDAVSLQRDFRQSQWDGGPLAGSTLLLHAEQGFGDAIQFIRYLPLVAKAGGKIILECQPELQRLFQRMAPDLPVLARGQTLPAFEVHCPLLSLPRVFSADLGNIPHTVPYLHADTAEAAIWRERLSGLGSSIRPSGPDLKVGLVWAGRPTNTNDRNRSLKLASLAPLAEVPGVRFISLQKDAAAVEARTPPAGMELIDVAEDLRDFADTAALIANLDLVIAVDTAVVHLAGAMGTPVWTLLPFAPDWRWLLDRTDSPWYPTMRLFRQPSPGDWGSVIQGVASELAAFERHRPVPRRG